MLEEELVSSSFSLLSASTPHVFLCKGDLVVSWMNASSHGDFPLEVRIVIGPSQTVSMVKIGINVVY
jgi:hypothetical protein